VTWQTIRHEFRDEDKPHAARSLIPAAGLARMTEELAAARAGLVRAGVDPGRAGALAGGIREEWYSDLRDRRTVEALEEYAARRGENLA
jgi:hypothetical protein